MTTVTNLVDIQNIKTRLLYGRVDEVGELSKHLASKQFVTRPVDRRAEIDSVRKTLDAQGTVGSQTQSSLRSLTLQLQLSQTTSVLLRVDLVLLDKLLGKVINNELIQRRTTKLIVVSGSQDGVHAPARSENSNIRTKTAKVGNDRQLIGHGSLRSRVVRQSRSNRLLDKLEDLNTRSLG